MSKLLDNHREGSGVNTGSKHPEPQDNNLLVSRLELRNGLTHLE